MTHHKFYLYLFLFNGIFVCGSDSEYEVHESESEEVEYSSKEKNNSSSSTAEKTTSKKRKFETKEKEFKPLKSRNIYNPTQSYKISRTGIERYKKCQQCFVLYCFGLNDAEKFPFVIQSAVDGAQKARSDIFAQNNQTFPAITAYNENPKNDKKYNLKPYLHPLKNKWLDALHYGLQLEVPETNIMLTGAPDELLIDQEKNELYIADFKASALKNPPTSMYPEQKNQLAFYQYLLMKNEPHHGLKVNHEGLILHSNFAWPKSDDLHNIKVEETLLSHTSTPEDFTAFDAIPYEIYECLTTAQRTQTLPPSNPKCSECLRFNARLNFKIPSKKNNKKLFKFNEKDENKLNSDQK